MDYFICASECLVAKQPVIVLRTLFCSIRHFVVLAFARLDNQASEAQFRVEQMDCMRRIFRHSLYY